MRQFFTRYGRYLLGAVGLLAIAYLVHKVGPRAVWGALKGAGLWLPLILVLDLGWMATESLALRLLYGERAREIPGWQWIRAVLLHYATFIVVPVGRASAEVARASLLSTYVGKTRAAAGAALMQSLTLMTNSIMSGVCLVALLVTVTHPTTAGFLSVNFLLTGFLGFGLYSVLRHVKIGGFLGRRFEKLSRWGPEIDEHVRESKGRHLSSLGLCVAARSVQAMQYGVILLAITGTATVPSALIAEGIQLAGRSLGDAVPNQVGAVEGAFTVCAAALDLADHPEKAVAIALLGRISNLTVAGFSALMLQVLPRATQQPTET